MKAGQVDRQFIDERLRNRNGTGIPITGRHAIDHPLLHQEAIEEIRSALNALLEGRRQ